MDVTFVVGISDTLHLATLPLLVSASTRAGAFCPLRLSQAIDTDERCTASDPHAQKLLCVSGLESVTSLLITGSNNGE